MKKRMLSILLCCVMLLGLLSTAVTADTIPGTMLEGRTDGSFFYLNGTPPTTENYSKCFLFLTGGETQFALAGGELIPPEDMYKDPRGAYRRNSNEGGRGDCIFIDEKEAGLRIWPYTEGGKTRFYIMKRDGTFYKRSTDLLYRHSLGSAPDTASATGWVFVENGDTGTYLIKEYNKDLYWNADTDNGCLSVTGNKDRALPFTFYVRDTPTYVFGFTVRYPGGSLKFSTVPEGKERKINGIVSPIKITLPCVAMQEFELTKIIFFHKGVSLAEELSVVKRAPEKYASSEPDIVTIAARTLDGLLAGRKKTEIKVEVRYEGHKTKSGRSIDQALDSDYTVTEPGSCVEQRTRYLECKNCHLKVLWDTSGYGDHDWEETKYTWSDDHLTCTAARSCKNDESHTETASAEVSLTETPPTCTSDGTCTYTAVFDADWAETQTYTGKGGKADANNHTGTLGDWQMNEREHWKEYSCCHAKAEEAEHVYDDDADTTCDICGYTRTVTPSHTHDWAEAWDNDDTHHWHACTADGCDITDNAQKDGYAAHVYDNDADATCNTCGYTRTVAPDTYTVTFDASGGMVQPASMVTNTDGTLESLPTPTRGGSYRFAGWYTEKSGGTRITTDTVFTADTTVYAHWTYTGSSGSDDGLTYYTLTFNTNGGSAIASERFRSGAAVDLSGYTPSRSGYTFTGWYADKSLTDRITAIRMNGNKTVYAGWQKQKDTNPFVDVSESDWFYDDVTFVYERELMLGTGDTMFSPYGAVTRAMMATILWRMEGSPAPASAPDFTDVASGKWYSDAIAWTTENGVYLGYGNGRFGPDDLITREQLAAVFCRYAACKGGDVRVKGAPDTFADQEKVSAWAQDAMNWAVASGLMQGRNGNVLDPQGTATRAEVAAMLRRFAEK